MRVRKKFSVKEKGFEIYNNSDVCIFVSREKSDDLCFEVNNRFLDHFVSYDIGESVAAIMSIRKFNDDVFWTIKVDDRHYDVDAEKCLYWLSGGDKAWRGNETRYNCTWGDCSYLFMDKFSEIIYDIIDESKTLNDIKLKFRKSFSLSLFYEFGLENNIIKM